MPKKQPDRKQVLLRAAYEILRKIEASELVDALENSAFYDDADCDGVCLIKDIALELNIEDDD